MSVRGGPAGPAPVGAGAGAPRVVGRPTRRRTTASVPGSSGSSELTAGRGGHDLDHYLGLASRRPRPRGPPALLGAARRDLRGLDAVSLQHRDLSAQNWLVDGTSFVGLVDWETADLGGVPGPRCASGRRGAARARRRPAPVVPGPRRADVPTRPGTDEPLFVRARTWHRECVRAATGSDRLADPLVVAFFARRLGRRISGGGPGDALRGDRRGDARGRHRLRRALSRPSRPGRRRARHAPSAIAAAMLGLRLLGVDQLTLNLLLSSA